jgi:hypothetical protein
MSKIFVGALAIAAALAIPHSASAQGQQTPSRIFVNFGVGIQGGSQELSTSTDLHLNEEDFALQSTRHVEGGLVIDLSGGYRVWRKLSVGAGFTKAGKEGNITAFAGVPDPLFTDRPREVSAVFEGASHTEIGIHLMGVWPVWAGGKLDVAVSAGPSFFIVSTSVPSDVAVTEPAPTLTSLTLDEADANGVGVNVGVDVSYMLTSRFGAGAMFRYTYSQVEIPGVTEKLTVGGPQGTVGLRVRF